MNSKDDKDCLLHEIVWKHRVQVTNILAKAKINRPTISDAFTTTPICETPQGERLTLNDLEKIYLSQHPNWDKEYQCFPGGPLFYDKLFNVQPYTRAKDIENKRQELKEKKGSLSTLPLDGELDFAKTTNEILTDWILNSLKQVIIDLKLTDNSRIKNQLPNILKLKLDGKSKELKGKDYNEAMDIILEVQNEVFDMILENDKIFKLYEMRCVPLSKIFK